MKDEKEKKGSGINKSTASGQIVCQRHLAAFSFFSYFFFYWPSLSASFPLPVFSVEFISMIYGAISLGHCLSSSLPSVSLRLRPTASKKGPQCKCDSFTSRPFVNRRFCGLSPALLVCFDPGNCGCDYCVWVCVCVLLCDTG